MLQSVQETGNEIWALHHSKSFVLLFLASTRKNKLKAEKYSKLLINLLLFAFCLPDRLTFKLNIMRWFVQWP